MSSNLVLYGFPMSTCTCRVAVVLKEKGIPFELKSVDLFTGEHKSPEFLAKQPFGQVPVLVDGDVQIFESRAIARYIALKFANVGTPLIPSPTDLKAWGLFEQAVSIEQSNFDPSASGLAVEKVFKPMRGMAADEAKCEEYEKTLTAKMEGYEAILSKTKYLAGDSLTAADLFHLPYGTIANEKLGFAALSNEKEFPNVARWWKEISNLPSWLETKQMMFK
ncbi:glutathione S-transferase-like protein [Schizopora paradoxa]|uniref:glutathione transferase n=1 Tax=Schizopora paradoxa TaxID=27342 RepID=A0A0H2S745_9AGAM|nr:glutathione S-transferase-like protein [Schizopora paradoxa]